MDLDPRTCTRRRHRRLPAQSLRTHRPRHRRPRESPRRRRPAPRRARTRPAPPPGLLQPGLEHRLPRHRPSHPPHRRRRGRQRGDQRVTTTTHDTDQTAAAILARRQHATSLLRNVEDALRKLRRDRARLTFRGVAARAGVSRTFLYENPAARQLVEDAIGTANQERQIAVARQDSQAEAPWRERALNAEDALTPANPEILQQRQRIAGLMGPIPDLEQTWSQDGLQRLTTENTTLRQR